jgi:hypothetical protein
MAADRYRTKGSWSVEIVCLAGTPDRHDVRSIAELKQWFPLADLEPGALALAV